MCVICVKKQGVQAPSVDLIIKMWKQNPHGAGYMYVRDNAVIIRKGFMKLNDLLQDLEKTDIKLNELCVYHFRISTQAGITPSMTHPFALTRKDDGLKALRVKAKCGIAHNGIISLTTNSKEKELSDTALFVKNYLTLLIRNSNDFNNFYVKDAINELVGFTNKLAIINNRGQLILINHFQEKDGLLFSNLNHERSGNYYQKFSNKNGWWSGNKNHATTNTAPSETHSTNNYQTKIDKYLEEFDW